jgi:hypothetical protein
MYESLGLRKITRTLIACSLIYSMFIIAKNYYVFVSIACLEKLFRIGVMSLSFFVGM